MIRSIRMAAFSLLCAGSGLAAAGGALAEDAMMQPKAHGAMQGHAMQAGAMKGDAMQGDAAKGETMADDAMKHQNGGGKHDAMQGDPMTPKAN